MFDASGHCGHLELITVVGNAAVISSGEWVIASGEWVNDRTRGQQFKARFVKTLVPTSIDGIENTIEAEPERLGDVTGIGPVRARRITDAWAEQTVVREIMVFLHSYGVGTARPCASTRLTAPNYCGS